MGALPDPLWFLPSPPGNGEVWGAGTYNLNRSNANQNTWDANCRVTPLIGGYEATADMRTQLKAAIAAAPTNPNGYVYIADWRFNSARDLQDPNDPTSNPAQNDESAVGWVLRLMQAGISVRVLLWMPSRSASNAIVRMHAQDHVYVARVIQAYDKANRATGATAPLGVCLLDRRLPNIPSAHHQKMMIIRVGAINVAYCGGVDLAYTRRDTPDSSGVPPSLYSASQPQFLGGDPQSGSGFMGAQSTDPGWTKRNIGSLTFPSTAPPSEPAPDDLPANVYLSANQYWHDQHVKLEGPVVTTLEWLFYERWMDDSVQPPLILGSSLPFTRGPLGSAEIIVTTSDALTPDQTGLAELTHPTPVPALVAGSAVDDITASVQIWRTVPLRNRGSAPYYFSSGEFTVMQGVANAVSQATELIWIFDQYFWSMPLAVQLNAQLYSQPNLRVIIVVPPHADAQWGAAHWARQQAYNKLAWVDPAQTSKYPNGVQRQFSIYTPWATQWNCGIYVHAKTHIYDANLLLIGSANCNARSYTGDTEVVAAILDTPTIYAHMKRLWAVLLPNSPWPWGASSTSSDSLPISNPGWGQIFFGAFTSAANAQTTANYPFNNLTKDTLYVGGSLPNGANLPVSALKNWGYSKADDVLESHGLDPDMEIGSPPQLIRPLNEIALLVQGGYRVMP